MRKSLGSLNTDCRGSGVEHCDRETGDADSRGDGLYIACSAAWMGKLTEILLRAREVGRFEIELDGPCDGDGRGGGGISDNGAATMEVESISSLSNLEESDVSLS